MFVFATPSSFTQSDETWIDLYGANDFLDFGMDTILFGKTRFTVEMKMHFENTTGGLHPSVRLRFLLSLF